MAENGWRTMRLSEVEPYPGPAQGLEGWLPLRSTLGVEAFGVNAWVGRDEGDDVIEEHDEINDDPALNHEELYVVIEGQATFTVDGNEFDAPRGTLVFVKDPSITRHAVARSPGTTILAIGATPGEVFTPSPWEKRRLETRSV
jgi:hypothetical protein